ncbi:hypothetical protein K505DRAFT_348446 [Melanomma pulvis-pyrius CBS 109.77]|uniref:MARVEL domain-containing protein n=1 Tax=Melanomma pulvis-pyrius CBS 109.77 TaxID=1314802 RepID=A0A6A6XJD5_9PLEO|nr:hypothetical protein K505DRAFT_348446 [Melanomma pulvis-pyrius CBS 109.77]
MPNAIITLALRGAQLLFSVVVLGLSVSLIRDHKYGSLPVPLGYAAFVGGITVLGAFIGIASAWVELLQGIIGAGIDAFLLLINVAGGIIFAYKMRGTDCSRTDPEYLVQKLNPINLLNGGCDTQDGITLCWWQIANPKKLNSHCRESQADSVFMFLTVIILIACLTMTFLHQKR